MTQETLENLQSRLWKKVQLGNITNVIFSGGTPDTRIEDYWNGGIRWMQSGETRNKYISNTDKTISKEGIKNSSTKLAKINDIVVASADQGNTRGQVSFCLIDTYINQSLISLRPNREKIYPKFLFFNLSSRYNELRKLSESNSIRGSLTVK